MTNLTLFGIALAPLYAAIAQVESDRGATSDNVYQLRTVYVADVNRITDNHFSYSDRLDRRRSEAMMYLYWEYYGAIYELRTGKKPTYEVLARIHNGGPTGYRKHATYPYWLRVRRELNKQGIKE